MAVEVQVLREHNFLSAALWVESVRFIGNGCLTFSEELSVFYFALCYFPVNRIRIPVPLALTSSWLCSRYSTGEKGDLFVPLVGSVVTCSLNFLVLVSRGFSRNFYFGEVWFCCCCCFKRLYGLCFVIILSSCCRPSKATMLLSWVFN